MVDWPRPTTLKKLRGFLGLTGNYRRFVQGYGMICKPLTMLLQKNAFLWSDSTEQAFLKQKECMSSTPVLAMPNFNENFVVETNACNQGVGDVLIQKGRPLAYLSKALSPKHRALSTYEKELLAIIMAVDKWRPYLQGHHFTIKSDHQSLKFFHDQRVTTLLQKKWLSKLMGLHYDIIYKKGSENIVADGLSRLPSSEEGSIQAISVTRPMWMTELEDSYKGDFLLRKSCVNRRLIASPSLISPTRVAF